jgi:hypothetical protein
MNTPTYIIKGIEAGPYVLNAEVSIEEETGILDVYTFDWAKEGEEVGAEHHMSLCEFFFEEVVSVIASSLETQGVFLDDN